MTVIVVADQEVVEVVTEEALNEQTKKTILQRMKKAKRMKSKKKPRMLQQKVKKAETNAVKAVANQEKTGLQGTSLKEIKRARFKPATMRTKDVDVGETEMKREVAVVADRTRETDPKPRLEKETIIVVGAKDVEEEETVISNLNLKEMLTKKERLNMS